MTVRAPYMSAGSLTERLKEQARQIGFDLVGVCPAEQSAGYGHLQRWIASGFAGQMRYLADRIQAYEHPRHVLGDARSVVMLGTHYRTQHPRSAASGEGRVSRYAWGPADYHDVLHQRLRRLRQFLLRWAPNAQARGVVDTAPLMERDFARQAGLGWIGKNTMLINRDSGSWFFLAALITDLELEYDSPHTTDHCGTCRACLDACPTGAFPEPGVLDARRCISYLTIELRDSIPEELRPGMGDWIFGCDVCQQVCPWNRKAPQVSDVEFLPQTGSNPVDLCGLFQMTDQQFRARFRRTPLWRTKRAGILRNAAIVLGNQRHAQGLDALASGLDDPHPLVREACAWALGRLGNDRSRQVLQSRRDQETDPGVQSAIDQALIGG